MWPFCQKEKSVHVDVNIDYDKLAEAIVKAQNKAAKDSKRVDRVRASFMSTINVILYSMVSFSCAVISIGFIANPLIEKITIKLLCIFLFLFLSISCGACAVESYRDSDENAQKHFNTNITFFVDFFK